MKHEFMPTNITINQIFPTVKILDFEISHDPREELKNLNKYMPDLVKHDLLQAADQETKDLYAINLPVPLDKPIHTAASTFGDYDGHIGRSYILDYPEFKSLKAELLYCVKEYNNRYRTHNKDIKFANSWFNVMTKGAKLYFHIHNRSLLTGVYYPSLPKDSADLILIDPEYVRSLINSGKSLKLLDKKLKSKNDNRERKALRLEEGHLYIFPSWLEHGTYTNNSKNRVVISFNTDFVKDSTKTKGTEYTEKNLEKFLEGFNSIKDDNNKMNKEEFSRVLSSLCTESYVSPEPPLEDKIYYA